MNGGYIGVKEPTDPITFDPNLRPGTSKKGWVGGSLVFSPFLGGFP